VSLFWLSLSPKAMEVLNVCRMRMVGIYHLHWQEIKCGVLYEAGSKSTAILLCGGWFFTFYVLKENPEPSTQPTMRHPETLLYSRGSS